MVFQKEIDASIAAKADFEYLYDKPYEDRAKVRVAGPFTVESLSPHSLIVSGDAEEPATTSEQQPSNGYQFEGTAPDRDFATMILENLRTSGVHFLGANDPYKALKTTLKAEIDQDAWASLNSDISRPFPKPASGRIAVKVINHLGDEAMKVIRV